MSLKVKGIEELTSMMKEVERKAPGRIEKKLDEITKKVRDDTKSNTPVITGNLKKGFKAKKAYKIGSSYVASVYNDAYHSHLVEEGHRMVISRGPRKGEEVGWVDGRFMLRDATEKTNKTIEKTLQSWLPEVYKELNK